MKSPLPAHCAGLSSRSPAPQRLLSTLRLSVRSCCLVFSCVLASGPPLAAALAQPAPSPLVRQAEGDADPANSLFSLQDRFGRSLQERGLDLVDWEGALANPKVSLVVCPGSQIPADRYPLRIVVRTSTPRLMLNRFSELTEEGAVKILHIEQRGEKAAFELTVFPDQDGANEVHALTIDLEDAAEHTWTMTTAVRIEDRDVKRQPGLPITIDYSHDPTGFFKSASKTNLTVDLLERAARELGDLLDDQGFAPVAAGQETSWVWDKDSFESGHGVTNELGYSGMLVLAQGIHTPGKHSGSCASDRSADAFQVRGDTSTGLRRSGSIAIEVSGNWNGRGWYLDPGDGSGWMHSRNIDEDQHDLLSIARHELTHVLAFHSSHRAFVEHLQGGHFVDPTLGAYLGANPKVDASEHLFSTVDPISGFGAFGNEYGSIFPWRRWLPTKTDLLVLQAVGYRLRPHSALVPLALLGSRESGTATSLNRDASTPLQLSLEPTGGVPPYHLELVTGSLPPGLTLDGWIGDLTGSVSDSGSYSFRVRLEDQAPSNKAVEQDYVLHVTAPVAAIEAQATNREEPAEEPDLYEQADFWKPDMETEELDPYLAPLLYVEANDASPSMLAAVSRLGNGSLLFDPTRPVLYVEDGQVDISGHSHRQILFAWNMAADKSDSAVLHALRITFASDGFPWIFETPELNRDRGGAPDVVYVTDAAEEAARAAFGAALSGKEYVIEASAPDHGPRVVKRIGDGGAPMGPYVYLSASGQALQDLHCRCEATRVNEQRSMISYELLPMDETMSSRLKQLHPDFHIGAIGPGLRLPNEF